MLAEKYSISQSSGIPEPRSEITSVCFDLVDHALDASRQSRYCSQ
jgi:hypothetical protein